MAWIGGYLVAITTRYLPSSHRLWTRLPSRGKWMTNCGSGESTTYSSWFSVITNQLTAQKLRICWYCASIDENLWQVLIALDEWLLTTFVKLHLCGPLCSTAAIVYCCNIMVTWLRLYMGAQNQCLTGCPSTANGEEERTQQSRGSADQGTYEAHNLTLRLTGRNLVVFFLGWFMQHKCFRLDCKERGRDGLKVSRFA